MDSVCTGKDGIASCGGIGFEGTSTEAAEQSRIQAIPAYPILRSGSAKDIECTMGIIAIALNGVSIYSGAVDFQCNMVDPNSSTSEWTSFDMCGGHSERTGDYHYHFPPTCLEHQMKSAATVPSSLGFHSAQIGWAFDGFPIYGPISSSGALIDHAALDECSGLAGEIPSLDSFKYRYYMTGQE